MINKLVKKGKDFLTTEAYVKIALVLISFLAFSCRIFSVIKYESVIHEYDPFFNLRTTAYLIENGFKKFWYWYDEKSWYPKGRFVGQTSYPGIMVSGYLLYKILNFFGIVISVVDACVFLGPIYSVFTVLAVYSLMKRCTNRYTPALIADLIVATVPAYVSRSNAGGFDNEAVAIFTMVWSFDMFIKACKDKTRISKVLCVVSYIYMISSWGGYVFVTNVVAIYVLFLLFLGKIEHSIITAYLWFYIGGTIWCLFLPTIRLQTIYSAEHILSHIIASISVLWIWKTKYSNKKMFVIKNFILIAKVSIILCTIFVYFLLQTDKIRFTGRNKVLIDPNYTPQHSPLVASISEHQIPKWHSHIINMGMSLTFATAGIHLIFNQNSNFYLWFLGIYALLSSHFASIMVRLNLIMAPAIACLIGIVCDHILTSCLHSKIRKKLFGKICYGVIMVVTLFVLMNSMLYSLYMDNMAYSNPSIIFSRFNNNFQKIIIDDYREGYQWLNQNTENNAKILHWWDYGYQMAYMANRTTFNDNNTNNATQIAITGVFFTSDEYKAAAIAKELDVDYVVVIFGGLISYNADDINKLVWMSRIANYEFPKSLNKLKLISKKTKKFDVGINGSEDLHNTIMYRMVYHDFASNVNTNGFDMLRKTKIPKVTPLKLFTQVYTSASWKFRIYKVNKYYFNSAYKELITQDVIDFNSNS